MEESERAELIAALHQSATFGEGMLDLNERLLDALDNADARVIARRPVAAVVLSRGAERWLATSTPYVAVRGEPLSCAQDRVAHRARVTRGAAATRGARVRQRAGAVSTTETARR
jgi:hypothetical protein